jgi:hypothetical protein
MGVGGDEVSEKYVPQVGDRVRRPEWSEAYLDVAYVGSRWITGTDHAGVENVWSANDPWIKVEPRLTVREQWGMMNHVGNFIVDVNEEAARAHHRVGHLARIAAVTVTDEHVGQVWPVVCDEWRVPLGVEVEG